MRITPLAVAVVCPSCEELVSLRLPSLAHNGVVVQAGFCGRCQLRLLFVPGYYGEPVVFFARPGEKILGGLPADYRPALLPPVAHLPVM